MARTIRRRGTRRRIKTQVAWQCKNPPRDDSTPAEETGCGGANWTLIWRRERLSENPEQDEERRSRLNPPRILKDTHRAGIWTHAFLILDFPGEGDAELLETINLVAAQLKNLDSLVFHDFHLPPELVDYLNFTGRVPVDESESALRIYDRTPRYQSNAAALRAFVDVFLENFLQFAHDHGNVHSMPIAPLHAQGLLHIYRKRWLRSPEFARSRITLMVFRALIQELDRLRLTVLINEADANLPLLKERKILRPQSEDPQEHRLATLAYAGRLSLRQAVSIVQRELLPLDSCPKSKELLDLLFEALALRPPRTALDAAVGCDTNIGGERLVPEGWR